MALYSIGASWNPNMSQYNRVFQRGLAGIKGLEFAYRLNTWGPKTGPAMLPANTFSSAYVPNRSGLSGPFSWIEGLVGMEAPQDILTDAQNALDSAVDPLMGAQVTVQTILSKAQAYDSVAEASVQAKAQAVEAEAAGLINTYMNLQSTAQGITNQIQGAKGDPNLSKEAAQHIKDQVSPLDSQISSFSKAVSNLQSHMTDLVKYAQSGPGLGQSLESAAVKSVSTLTWILGGGALIYFLGPTFLPRMAAGIRKTVKG